MSVLIPQLLCASPSRAFLLFVFPLEMCQFSPSLVVYVISNSTGDISLRNPWERPRWDPAHCRGISRNLHFHNLLGVCRVLILELLPFFWPDCWCTLMNYGCAMSWQGSPQCRVRLLANLEISRLLSTEAADQQLVKPSLETENTVLLLFSASAKGLLLSLFV